ncbi:Hypothetical predicted protein [Podarcis lilfordi]|uniref:Uncharacterized protein n=1 Tax=Podarcis lilfordi TaxID=74358 RepID=A0AA35LI85_9SAUR|nr:Hypothetical predicted protein [Podarcis lilfordi]
MGTDSRFRLGFSSIYDSKCCRWLLLKLITSVKSEECRDNANLGHTLCCIMNRKHAKLELRIKGSLELTVGAGETANWTGRGVEQKKYVVPLHNTSSENALQVLLRAKKNTSSLCESREQLNKGTKEQETSNVTSHPSPLP